MDRRPARLAWLAALIWGLCFVLVQTSLLGPGAAPSGRVPALIGGGVLIAWVAFRR